VPATGSPRVNQTFGVVGDLERCEAAEGDAVAQVEVFLFGVEEFPAARLRRQQDRKRAVLRRLDGFDGIHDHDKTNSKRHARSFGRLKDWWEAAV
jgi:hypothetical protein